MKNMIKLPAILLGLLLMFTGATQKVRAQGDDVSLQSFYDELSPYGTWIQDPQYGYVWRPDVEQDEFRPYYTNGRWAMTEYGNTWVSNYDWGWAPFHYGRWVYNRFNEWVWIPDTTWGPAWVSWRSGGGYYGWAPMGPGMNININFNIPSLWWVFVPQRNIYYDRFPRYYSRRNTVIINNTTIINNTYVNNRRTYYTGPRADDIRRSTGRDVRVYNVNTSSRPSRSNISGNNLNIYSPRPSRSNVNAAPREAIRGEGYTTIKERGERVGERGTRNTNNNSGTGRPSRTELQGTRENNPTGRTNNRENGVPTPSTRGERPSTENTDRPSRTGARESSVQNQQQIQERQQAQERMQQQRQQVQERQQTQERQQRQERVQQQQNAENQRQQYERSRRQSQESRPQQQAQPQYQRPERVQQSAPSRGNSGGGGRSESSRPSRGGRG